jgi:hypothetical protein
MSNRNMTFAKRQREQNQKDRVREREARRVERRAKKAATPAGVEGEDPDIAGIVPGPQAPPDDEE